MLVQVEREIYKRFIVIVMEQFLDYREVVISYEIYSSMATVIYGQLDAVAFASYAKNRDPVYYVDRTMKRRYEL